MKSSKFFTWKKFTYEYYDNRKLTEFVSIKKSHLYSCQINVNLTSSFSWKIWVDSVDYFCG